MEEEPNRYKKLVLRRIKMTIDELLKHYEELVSKSEPLSQERLIAVATWDKLMSLTDQCERMSQVVSIQKQENEKLGVQNVAQHNMIEWMEDRIEQLEDQLKGMEEN